MKSRSIRDSICGSLFGLAIGDALGAPIEFESPGTFDPITEYRGGGPFDLPAGSWTDDTSLALCLADSLIECKGFDPTDQMTRYLRWYDDGYLSVNDDCFDIGNTTRQALNQFRSTGNPWSGLTDSRSAGNGSLMRLAPIPLFFHSDPEKAIDLSGESSRTTHALPSAVDACRYAGALIAGACNGASKEELLSPLYSPIQGYWNSNPLCPEIEEIATGSFLKREPPEIRGRGHVVQALEAALWAFAKGKDFRESVLLAVNLGDDSDTTGAICGQIAGAYCGIGDIPKEWINGLIRKEVIEKIATGLFKVSFQM